MNTATLQKRIGFIAATSIVAGSVIGAGVFMKPSTMAVQVHSPLWLILVWVIAGIFSLLGALVFAELGSMFPDTGGIYAYFKKMFGEFPAFLFGWAALAVINTASVAAIAYVCASYADYFLQLPSLSLEQVQRYEWNIPFIGKLYPLDNLGVKSLGILIIIIITLVNSRSVKGSSILQVISTFFKLALIILLVIGIFSSANGSAAHWFAKSSLETDHSLMSGIIMAMTGAFFAYDGWINVNYIAGEIKRPQRNIPLSLFAGVIICIGIYLLVNLAYLYVLPIERIAKSPLVASDAIAIALGQTSGALVAAMIVITTFGAINGNIMATTRVTFAMGRDRVFWPWTGKVHTKYSTPANAIWLHGIWTSFFIFTGSFDMLVDMFVFVTWIVYGVGAVGIFLLRKRLPDHPRPYRIWGYPIVPFIFIAFSAFFLFYTIWNDVTNFLADKQPVINSLLGIVLTALGVPLYFTFRKLDK